MGNIFSPQPTVWKESRWFSLYNPINSARDIYETAFSQQSFWSINVYIIVVTTSMMFHLDFRISGDLVWRLQARSPRNWFEPIYGPDSSMGSMSQDEVNLELLSKETSYFMFEEYMLEVDQTNYKIIYVNPHGQNWLIVPVDTFNL